MPHLALIAALAKNRVIGYRQAMPWHMPADLRHFKQITLGKAVIMGRKTFESIGRPLPGRRNIVVTRAMDYKKPGIEVVPSLADAIRLVGEQEAMVIGGGELYRTALSQVNRMYLTWIDCAPQGDVFFPDYDVRHWREIAREDHSADQQNPYAYSFVVLERTLQESGSL